MHIRMVDYLLCFRPAACTGIELCCTETTDIRSVEIAVQHKMCIRDRLGVEDEIRLTFNETIAEGYMTEVKNFRVTGTRNVSLKVRRISSSTPNTRCV